MKSLKIAIFGTGFMGRVHTEDPVLSYKDAASYADLPGGHSEGYDDTFKQISRRFYRKVADSNAPVECPAFVDDIRQMLVLDAVLESSQKKAWVNVKGLTAKRRSGLRPSYMLNRRRRVICCGEPAELAKD